ncbi:helix-turn-helix domain-containing protein, partial [Virgisporangium aurantiacum]|uniref:helix-turn-helix domain-containing protein n=1 Tax=Virgisporangium aurantiacum TaxID=175570 RepID=UPI00194F6B48
MGRSPTGYHRELRDLLLELHARRGKLPYRAISKLSGLSIGAISGIFNGKSLPGPDTAVALAGALNATDGERKRVRFLAEKAAADRADVRAETASQIRRPRWAECPYLGLFSFEENHARLFYGRRDLTGRLVDRLRGLLSDPGMLLLVGPSGAGKSSLLRAGLMSALARGDVAPGCDAWPRQVITPTEDPVRELAVAMANLIGIDAVAVRSSLRDSPDQAHLLVAQALEAAGLAPRPDSDGTSGTVGRVVLAVDQFEQLFTLTKDPQAQATFLTALDAMATVPVLPGGEPGALIVSGVRGDFLDQATRFPPLQRAAEENLLVVGAMSESELREAITGPAAEAGVDVPDDLCIAVLDDLRERGASVGFGDGALPLLSQVMFVMWQAKETEGLSRQAYLRTGGVANIVRTTAEAVYTALSPDQQDTARRVFVQLTFAGDGPLAIHPRTRASLRIAAGPDADTVVEAFAARRLITVTDNDLVAIAHEEVLRSWNTLRDWLTASATDRALRLRLVDDVHTWLANGRNTSYLYSGRRLEAAQDAVGRWTGDPAPDIATFLEASERGRKARTRRARSLTTVVAVLLSAILVAVGVVTWQWRTSVTAHKVERSRQLAAQSAARWNAAPVEAAALALAAWHASPTVEARSAVLTAYGHRVNDRLVGHVGSVGA